MFGHQIDDSTTTDQTQPLITSTVLAVLLRVAGIVQTGTVTHGREYPERQASVRIGDVVIYLRDPKVAALLHQRWHGTFGSALLLRERVSQTWLRPRPGTYPAAVSVQLTDQTTITHRFVAADPDRRQPAYLEIRVDQLVWQVCDQLAWRTIVDALLEAHKQLLR